ncbi:MAG: serine/threonine protein kinase, partial [Anaerolineales bacterium]|nr:serine/threonine protein kinase [Anaerolineales bacterium]
MADWTGKTLGRVQINDLIARGGMAEIYSGIHETHGLVAVKVMRGLLERDEHQLTRFKREAEVIGELRHPYIVRMLDFTIEEETPCLIMDYIPGPSLATYMKELHNKNQRIPIAVIAQILRSVASALDYAHSRGIVHRDIKPANILLRSPTQDITPEQPLPLDVEPILTDFGLVRLIDSTLHTTTGSVSGTPTYMSPEQARGENVDKRTDIYSLGIVLYEMLAGQIPFQADSTFGMLMKHINEAPPQIKDVSSDLHALLDRALAKDPDLRFTSAGEMASEFLSIFNGQTATPATIHIAKLARKHVEELKTPKSIPPAQPSSRFRWIRVAVETMAALLLAFVIFQFVSPGTATDTDTPLPRDPDISVGRLRFGDFSSVMDEIQLTLNTAELPEDDHHYEAWLVSDDGATTRKLGLVTFN